jgi:hypothetical protein
MTTTSTNGNLRIGREPHTYEERGDHSYYLDLVRAEHPERELGNAARERLLRHEHELKVDAKAETRAVTATYGDPPQWLVSKFAKIPRPDRVLANAIDAAGGLVPLPQKPGFSASPP